MAGSTAASRISQRREQFDLVICYDVLQYLDATETQRALRNLARVCRGLLYFGVLTREDWEENCDQSRTDPAVSLRGGAWYRRELGRNFRHLGAGFWLRRDCPITVWEMDTAGGIVSQLPKHTSLEREFFAAVPPRPAPWLRRVRWWLMLRAVSLRPVQMLLERRNRP